ncbi:MAG TPA: serine hydrolase domain-containing protein [Chthoniobacterales bacterium]|jgi:CubicO group peptidase (beta-lactamase class C family)
MVGATLAATALSIGLFQSALSQPLGESPAPVENQDGRNAEKVDVLFAPWSKGDTPGAAVIVIQNGKVLLKKGYGLADLETKQPITPDTAFRLASLTKQFTAMAVMMLADRGKLSFEDSLSKFFPEFPPYAQKVTVRHLLNHTAGFPEFEQLWLQNGRIDCDWPRSSKTDRTCFEPDSGNTLNLLAQVKILRFTPGARYEYSNSGYVILGQIVEKVSHQSLAQFFKEKIFKPLGMNRSILDDETRPELWNAATSYEFEDGIYKDIDYTPLNLIYGEDNIFSTVEDMYKWDQALYTEKLVKAATLEKAFTPGKLNDGTPIGYGFGWRLGRVCGLDARYHRGDWVGFQNDILRFPSEHFTVVVLSNVKEFDPEKITEEISKIYLADKLNCAEKN